jgi:hypothetical protein
MKTLQQAILISASLFSANVFGQISISQSDIWAVNDTIPRVVDTMATAGPGSKGANQVWNFSTAVPRLIETSRIISASSSTYASSFSSSNQGLTHDNSSYLFVNSSSSSVLVKGLVGDVLSDGGTNIVPFSPAMILMQFPENYGNTYTSTYGFDFSADGSPFSVNEIRVKHTGTVFDSLDGWGSITTPTGTYDCLRKKITEHGIDSTWYKLFSFSSWTFDYATDAITTAYNWLAKGTKMPVAELSLHPNGTPYKFTYSLIPPIPPITTGIQLNSISPAGFKLYPNPANDQIYFVPSLEFNTSVFDIRVCNSLGQEVFKTTSSSAIVTSIDISRLAPGLYFLEASAQNQQLRSRGVFSVAH